MALRREVMFFGPLRNFIFLSALLIVITFGAIACSSYFLFAHKDYSYACLGIFIPIFTLTLLGYFLHKKYFFDLPHAKAILAFFERNHPELCSWLPDSALLEAKILYSQKEL